MKIIYTTFFVLGIGVLGACKPETTEDQKPYIKSEATVIDCSDYLNKKTPSGIIYNNVWNKHAAKSEKWSQCLQSRNINGEVQYGWSWQWLDKSKTIFGYPQIKIGLSPWAPSPFFDTRLPKQYANISSFTVDYDIETQTNGQHNLAFTLWLTKTKVEEDVVDKSNITTELMIWPYATPKLMTPAGKRIADILLDDKNWEIWVNENWSDDVNTNTWTYITFRATDNTLSDKLDIHALLTHAVKLDIIAPNAWVSDLELGNEINSGSGESWVRKFNVQIETK